MSMFVRNDELDDPDESENLEELEDLLSSSFSTFISPLDLFLDAPVELSS